MRYYLFLQAKIKLHKHILDVYLLLDCYIFIFLARELTYARIWSRKKDNDICFKSIMFKRNKKGKFYKTVWVGFYYKYHHHHRHHPHHHIAPLARISLTLTRHFSLSFITSGRSSGLHPVSSHSCCMYVRAGRPAFARQYVGVQRSTLFMSSSLLLKQYPACSVRLTWIVFVMGGR